MSRLGPTWQRFASDVSMIWPSRLRLLGSTPPMDRLKKEPVKKTGKVTAAEKRRATLDRLFRYGNDGLPSADVILNELQRVMPDLKYPVLIEVLAKAAKIPAERHDAFVRSVWAVIANAKSELAVGDGKADDRNSTPPFEDTTLGRLRYRYEKRLREYIPPEGGIQSLEQAREAGKLVSTFQNLVKQQVRDKIEPTPENEIVTVANRQRVAFYEQQKRQGRPPRPRGRPPKNKAATPG